LLQRTLLWRAVVVVATQIAAVQAVVVLAGCLQAPHL
jgi:hypothetical protein